MIDNGLVDEAKMLLGKNVDRTSTCWQAIGYKEMLNYLEGKETLEQAADRIRIGTRHYAKRQITFLRRIGNIQYIPTDDAHAYERLRHIMKSKGETEYEERIK